MFCFTLLKSLDMKIFKFFPYHPALFYFLSLNGGNFKAFAFFNNVCTTILFFASPFMKMYSSLLLELSSLCFFFCTLHAFKYKFYDENYKKCISCDSRQHQQKNYFPLDAPFTFIMSGACLYLWLYDD